MRLWSGVFELSRLIVCGVVDKRQTGPLLCCANASRTHKTSKPVSSCDAECTGQRCRRSGSLACGRLPKAGSSIWAPHTPPQPTIYLNFVPGTSAAGGSRWSRAAGIPPSHSCSATIRPSAFCCCCCCAERVANAVLSCPFFSRLLPCRGPKDSCRNLKESSVHGAACSTAGEAEQITRHGRTMVRAPAAAAAAGVCQCSEVSTVLLLLPRDGRRLRVRGVRIERRRTTNGSEICQISWEIYGRSSCCDNRRSAFRAMMR